MAEITVATVPDLPPLNDTFQTGLAQYYRYDSAVRYHRDEGLLAIPTTTGMDVVRVSAPVCYKVVSWRVIRIGDKPEAPSADPGNANDVLLRRVFGSCLPGKLADGSPVWVWEGAYVYVMQTPPGDNDPLPIGSGPYDTEPASMHMAQPSDFLPTIFGTNQVPNGFTGTKLNLDSSQPLTATKLGG